MDTVLFEYGGATGYRPIRHPVFGIWPSIADFGRGWDGFYENGAEVQAELDEIVVPSNQRSMAVLYALSPSKGQYEPSNGLIRILGCELADGKTIEDAYAAGVSAAHKADEGDLGFNASFMMVPGPGAAPSQENHVYLVEAFPEHYRLRRWLRQNDSRYEKSDPTDDQWRDEL